MKAKIPSKKDFNKACNISHKMCELRQAVIDHAVATRKFLPISSNLRRVVNNYVKFKERHFVADKQGITSTDRTHDGKG